jgi:hypothetical protein
MPRTNVWTHSVPTRELDQRSREARLRFEHIERLLVPRAAPRHSPVWRFLPLLSVGIYGDTPQESRIRGERLPLAAAGRSILIKIRSREALPLDATGRRRSGE